MSKQKSDNSCPSQVNACKTIYTSSTKAPNLNTLILIEENVGLHLKQKLMSIQLNIHLL